MSTKQVNWYDEVQCMACIAILKWLAPLHTPSEYYIVTIKSISRCCIFFNIITVKPTHHANSFSSFTVRYLIQTDPTPHCYALITYSLIHHHLTLMLSPRPDTTLRCTYHILSDTPPPNVDALSPTRHHAAMHLSQIGRAHV